MATLGATADEAMAPTWEEEDEEEEKDGDSLADVNQAKKHIAGTIWGQSTILLRTSSGINYVSSPTSPFFYLFYLIHPYELTGTALMSGINGVIAICHVWPAPPELALNYISISAFTDNKYRLIPGQSVPNKHIR